ncbi:MAG: 2-dehydropantoate 2-reductase [Acidimicrobiia bacterium]|nr:2-dehydropantoate 2-reductase [Acidimicrobiia bacterium]
MKIAIVGCGAMGSVYAGLLAEGGHEVWAVDPWTDHVDAINDRGLRVEGASGDRTVRLAGACQRPADIGQAMDVVVLATKVGQVTEAAESVAPILGSHTPVISIQNGLGGPQRAAAVLGDDRVIIGVVGGFGASMTGPGHVHHNGMEMVRFGEYAGPGATPRAEELAALWRTGGFTVATYDNVHQLVWEKLICNVAFSGPCTVSELRVGELLADPDASAISATCSTEAYRVARAKGIPLDFTDPVAYTRAFGGKIPDARPSMFLDFLAGRRCEIDAINGAIPIAAAEEGLEAPANVVVASLIRTKERQRDGT